MFDFTPLMRGHAALRYFELGIASSSCMQESVLKGLTHHAASARFGKDHSRVLGGKCLFLGGSTALREEIPGVYSGDLSGIEVRELPWWEAPRVFPSRELALIPDWEEKIDRLAHAALEEDIRAISGTPNWLLLFFEKLFSLSPGDERLERLFPDLELIIHGGVSFALPRALPDPAGGFPRGDTRGLFS